MNLAALKHGQSAVVQMIDQSDVEDDLLARRLRELGFVPGTIVYAAHQAPLFRNPMSFIVRGTHIALRRDEAMRVQIQLQESTAPVKGTSP